MICILLIAVKQLENTIVYLIRIIKIKRRVRTHCKNAAGIHIKHDSGHAVRSLGLVIGLFELSIERTLDLDIKRSFDCISVLTLDVGLIFARHTLTPRVACGYVSSGRAGEIFIISLFYSEHSPVGAYKADDLSGEIVIGIIALCRRLDIYLTRELVVGNEFLYGARLLLLDILFYRSVGIVAHVRLLADLFDRNAENVGQPLTDQCFLILVFDFSRSDEYAVYCIIACELNAVSVGNDTARGADGRSCRDIVQNY